MSTGDKSYPNYSPESFRVNWIAGDTLRDQLNGEIYAHGTEAYLSSLHAKLSPVPAYGKLTLFAETAAQTTRKDSRLPAAFLDGGAIGLDSVHRFLPHLMPLVDTKMSDTLSNVEEVTVGNPNGDALTPRARFVQSIFKQGEKYFGEHVGEHSSVLEAVRQTREYGGTTQGAFYCGFGFVMEQAARAYREDFKRFELEANQTRTDFEAALEASSGQLDQIRDTGVATWLDMEIGRTILAAVRQTS